MHVLLTGVSSFLGRHLAEQLSCRGLRLTGTYRTPTAAVIAAQSSTAWRYQLKSVDLADARSFAHLPTDVDVVVHVAGVSPEAGAPIDDMLACNVMGTCNLAKYALATGAKRLI